MLNDRYYNRRYFFFFLVISIVGLYLFRLYKLQLQSPEYEIKTLGNACYKKSIKPNRGLIYDRNGKLLVSNISTYDLMVTMNQTKGKIDTLALSELFNLDIEDLRQRFKDIKNRRKNRGYSPYTPQRLIHRLEKKYVARFREQIFRFPGFTLNKQNIRKYNYHHAAHVLGFLGEANRYELRKDSILELGDYIGKEGVERYYERELRGDKGVEIFFRDSKGRIKGRYHDGLEDEMPVDGQDLYLSIDSDLQVFGEKLMKGKRGAIVAIEPQTGQILCLVSAPSYDPELLDFDHRKEGLPTLKKEMSKPMFNRAIRGRYPPGSTFKTGQAGIFLKEGIVTPSMSFPCHRGYPLLNGKPGCHSHTPNPALYYSIATSCNSYYSWGMHRFLDDRTRYPDVQTAFEVWKNNIVRLGFGWRLGIDLPSEDRGYIPNSKVYDRIYPNGWSSSTIISISIGQGEIGTTPLQLANLASLIANRGYYYPPHVLKSFSSKTLPKHLLEKKDTEIKAEHWEHVVRGMAMAVSSGTCKQANFAPNEISVCGKTGTIQNRKNLEDHSAFIGFAPRDNSKIAVAVYVEHGGFGSKFGVPIGRLIMEYYLRQGKLSAESEHLVNYISNKRILYRHES